MKILKIALLALFFAESVCTADILYYRHEKIPSFETIRERVIKQPLFYPEIQNSRLVENYLHYFIDRPLFHDSRLRENESFRNSFLRNVEILKEYEINGFVTLSNAGGLKRMYKSHLQVLDEEKPYPGFSYMCGAAYASKPDKKWDERYLENYVTTLNSPHTLRIDGKIPVWAYHSQFLKPLQIKEFKEMLKEKTSVEPILFAQAHDLKFQQLYLENGKLTQAQMDELRKIFEDLLDECGGLLVHPTVGGCAGGDYTSRATSAYYRNCTLPMLLELLKQPRYKEKLVGAYVSKGYVNHRTGNISGEYGTSTFRLAMDELMLLNPDIVVFFEWNEPNENTYFQPSVNDGKTMQRLIKFYARRMRGQPATPNKGDDLSVPNLVFSSRQVLRLGDMLRYELLNIPDSDTNPEYRVQLVIRDYDGKILNAFPEETFKISEMKAVSFEIPSEQFAEHTLVLPELRVVNSAGKERIFEMQYNRIHPSVCWNYKVIMQPLRDMLSLKTKFNVEKTQVAGSYKITAQAESPEPLMQFELLDNESEVFAVDHEKKYDPENNIIVQGSFTGYSVSTPKMVFEVLNAPGWQWFGGSYRDKVDPPEVQVVENKVIVPRYLIHYYYPFPFTVTIPKATAADAVLEIDIAGLGKHSFTVAELKKLGKMARTFEGDSRLDLSVAKNLVDIPVPLLQKNTEFAILAETESRFPLYQLRGISSSGKIYRSRPVMPLRPGAATVRHNVFSAAKQQAVTVNVAKNLIPELNYLFDDARGAMLKNSWEPFFDAQLGGGFIYMEPFFPSRPRLAEITDRKLLNPAWQEADSVKVLNFDGVANYINLPREALPLSSFTLEFEIKPEGNHGQVLFRHFSYQSGSLSLFRRQGKLDATFTYRVEGLHQPSKSVKFESDLDLPAEKWSKVTVSYNLNELQFVVNEAVRKYPFSERGSFFKSSVFGGHTLYFGKDMSFFKGQLRSLRIRHSAEP
ncbi:MAG: LamG domain-containing protein [Bacteroidales bacterium]|nr:LamG domain-containing protein [Bacteroidales bacterium]